MRKAQIRSEAHMEISMTTSLYFNGWWILHQAWRLRDIGTYHVPCWLGDSSAPYPLCLIYVLVLKPWGLHLVSTLLLVAFRIYLLINPPPLAQRLPKAKRVKSNITESKHRDSDTTGWKLKPMAEYISRSYSGTLDLNLLIIWLTFIPIWNQFQFKVRLS